MLSHTFVLGFCEILYNFPSEQANATRIPRKQPDYKTTTIAKSTIAAVTINFTVH